MNKDLFKEQMNVLDERFKSGKQSPESVMKAYWRKCQYIPDEPFRQIIDQIITHQKMYPTPGDILAGWHEWQQSHPEKIAKREQPVCKQCDSNGYFDVEFVPKWIRSQIEELALEGLPVPEPIWYEGVVNCAHCRSYPFARRSVPMMTRDEVEENRWIRWQDVDPQKKPAKPVGSVREAVERAFGDPSTEMEKSQY